MSENRCVCCGTIIPEGSMVCSVCSKVEDNPVTPEEYAKNKLEYDRQTMIEQYGHCDGLE